MVSPPPPPFLTPLVEDFLRHLRREEDRLRAARDGLADLYHAVRRGDLDHVRATQPVRDAAAAARTAQPATRAAAPLAAALGLDPGVVTLSAVAAQLPPPWSEAVAAARDRLRGLAGEVADLQRRNATLVHHLRSFFGGVLAGLTGDDAPPARYGPAGGRLDPAAAAAISARG